MLYLRWVVVLQPGDEQWNRTSRAIGAVWDSLRILEFEVF